MTIPAPEPRGYPGNLGLAFADHAASTQPAIIDLNNPAQPRVVSYRELDQTCDAVARGLVRAGLQAGDRIGIVARNRVEFISTVFGAFRAGIVPVPVNVKLAGASIVSILDDAGAKMVFTEAALAPLVAASYQTVLFDAGDGANAFDQFIDPGPFEAFVPDAGSVAIQPYTSGSTGRPKGVQLTHFGQNWSRRVLAYSRGTTSADVILVAAPLYHKNALNAFKQGLTAGANLVLLPQFSVEQYISAIGQYQCTVISGVPTMMAMVLARKDLLAQIDTQSVRTVMMGSAPSSPKLLADVRAAFPNAQALVVYGTTEGGPVPLGPHPDGLPRPDGSIGVPYAGTFARLVDGDSEDQGELIVKNPGILAGYHNLPEETARRIRDGWYHTGDICRRDAQGFYYFVGRNDDMFVCGGENIFPIEVERQLEQHPAVHQAFVMPFEHELKGHVPYAFVVLRAGTSITDDELKQFALQTGPAYQHPREVFFLEQLPLAGTNKVDKPKLRDIAAATLSNQQPNGV